MSHLTNAAASAAAPDARPGSGAESGAGAGAGAGSVAGAGSCAGAGASAPLTVAIVGCGVIGVNHARAIGRQPGLKLVALVDELPEAATALAELVESEGGERPREYGSLGEALAGHPLDLVAVCTPSGLHVALAEEALASGAHVVIEKPLDVSMPRARRIAELAAEAEARGQVVSVISQHRFDPASVVVARAAQEGAFGRITSGVASVAWWRSQQYYDSGQWRGTWNLDGGGAVMNQGVHTVDLLVWFLGRPVEIFARTALLAHERVEVEDIAVATISFESGALAVLHATTAAYPELSARVQVHGSRGSAIIDDNLLDYFYASGGSGGSGADASGGDAGASVPGSAGGSGSGGAGGEWDASGKSAVNQAADVVAADQLRGAELAADRFIVGHLRQYDDIVDAIRAGRQPGVRVGDALISLAVVRAVYVSATLGHAVAFDDILNGTHDDVVVSTGASS
ncbi:Gfo/Idh/MocA family oxidoreductase [Subtercola lobariae]|uniref:Oxidoreductase n=1 Tax=Subtercola lobariae TaxID=1588641 RepID=A0A917B3N9_9MICO|nr:Gfo/Idh/MocA family oxidoreductase [Subtercola lobariae]GGF19550.1 oxidoreductase [Subtercola lobariae]